MSEKYKDILNLPHHVSAKRPHMPVIERAAQFAPFAALTGYDAAINEKRRVTYKKIEIDEENLKKLNIKLKLLIKRLADKPEVTFTYFKPDSKKTGGEYIKITDTVKKVKEFERLIVLQSGMEIPMDDIFEIEGEIFSAVE